MSIYFAVDSEDIRGSPMAEGALSGALYHRRLYVGYLFFRAASTPSPLAETLRLRHHAALRLTTRHQQKGSANIYAGIDKSVVGLPRHARLP